MSLQANNLPANPTDKVFWNDALIKRYDLAGPRYTSYPTAPQFTDQYTSDDWKIAALCSNTRNRPLSLYYHIPFCDTVCFYCGCNKVITANRSRAVPYLAALKQEVALQALHVNPNRAVKQIHLGGGTPTYLDNTQLMDLMQCVREHFNVLPDKDLECGIEVHPQTVTPERLLALRKMGFNRISIGVQDFDPEVQQAVNRFNSAEEVDSLVRACRSYGFKSVSLDLIYGLPRQTEQSFAATLNTIIEMRPDRLSLFNYAHMPQLFKVQRQINAEELPEPQTKLRMFEASINALLGAGYHYIGMDHFALPSDELYRAQRSGQLHRNFQGYTTGGDCDLLGFGVSSIHSLGGSYAQNAKDIEVYTDAIKRGQLAIARGYTLTHDDALRQAVINALACHFSLSIPAFEKAWNIVFKDYFQSAYPQLEQMATDGLIQLSEHAITITAPGRLLVRRVCMLFDRYLNANATHKAPQYSRIL